MVKVRREESTHLSIRCRKEHVEFTLTIMSSINARKSEKPRCTDLSKVRLYGSILAPANFKYKTATVYVSGHRAMEVDREVDDMGWVRTQGKDMLLYIFWPKELFQQLNVLASSGRISTIRADISPLQRGTAKVRAVAFDTQVQGERDEEFDYWFMSKPRKKKER